MKSFKKITSLSLVISFLIMSYTGIMLFVCPHGRVAYWNHWKFFGLTKEQYGTLHTTAMLLFLFFGIMHLYYNWKPLLSYIKDKTLQVSFSKKELLIALGINLVFVAGALTYVQPFKAYLDFEEQVKNYWTEKYGEPPYGHAEESKLDVFCRKMKIDFADAKQALKARGIEFKDDETLKSIARKHRLSPQEIYQIIIKE